MKQAPAIAVSKIMWPAGWAGGSPSPSIPLQLGEGGSQRRVTKFGCSSGQYRRRFSSEAANVSPSPRRRSRRSRWGEGRGEVLVSPCLGSWEKQAAPISNPLKKICKCSKSKTVLDCGGKRSATPLSHARQLVLTRTRFARSKAVSRLRLATAVQDADRLARMPLRFISILI